MAATPTARSCGNCPSAPLSLDESAKMPNCFCALPPLHQLPAPAAGPAAMARPHPRPNKCCTMTPCRSPRSAVSPPARFAKSPSRLVPIVYWRNAGPDLPLLLLVIKPLGYRLRKGSKLLYRQPAFLICTDPQLDLTMLLQAYVDRWEIECNHRDEKSLIGSRAGPGVESFGSHPPAAIPGSHLQLVAVGFHSGLRVSAHRRLSAATFMEKEVHSPFASWTC